MGNERILKPLFAKYLKPKKIFSFDVETKGVNNVFHMGGIYGDDGFKYFYNKEDFIKEFLSPKYFGNSYIVATNLGFDFACLFFNTKYWNRFKILMRGGNYLCCTVRNRKNQKSVYIDTMNYIMRGLSVLGQIIGIPKLETPRCISNINLHTPYKPMNKKDFVHIKRQNITALNDGFARKPYDELEEEELLIYNKRDCEVTYKFMKFLQDGVNQLGAKLQLTSASTAMDLYRRKYLRKNLYKEDYVLNTPDGETVNDFIFESYYGGRTEVFKRGTIRSTVKGFDVNSLYPSVMRNEYPHPASAKIVYENNISYINDYEGVSNVSIYAPYMKYPLLPLKHEGKLIFPIGLFSGTYTHVELRKALSIGYKIIKVHKTLYYKYNHRPFFNYVNILYNLRLKYKKDKNPMQEVVKLFLNSLYGKWGAKKFNETHIIDVENIDKESWSKWIDNPDDSFKAYTNDGKKIIFNKETRVNKAYQCPIYASYTTAYARILMFDHISELSNKGIDVLYMDTDSLFIEGEMQTTKALGGMSLDYECDTAIFVKPKMYMYANGEENFCKIKGVSRVDKEKFLKVLKGESVGYTSFMKTKSAIRRGVLPNTVIQNTKDLSLEDNKRVWEAEFNASTLSDSEPIKVNIEWKRKPEEDPQ